MVSEDVAISQGYIEVAVQVANATEAFTGHCYRCNKVGHKFCNTGCELYDADFLNTSQGPVQVRSSQQAPGFKG